MNVGKLHNLLRFEPAFGLCLTLALLGCQRTPTWDGKYPIYGIDRHIYAEAFSGAVTADLVRSLSDGDYIQNRSLGAQQAVGRQSQRLCGHSDLPTLWLKDINSCQLLSIAAARNCDDYDGCVTYDIDPELLTVPVYRVSLINSLEYPCGSLIDPATLESAVERDNRTPGVWLSPSELWRILRCREGGLHATVTNNHPGEIQIRF